MGVILTIYKSWDEPPSSTLPHKGPGDETWIPYTAQTFKPLCRIFFEPTKGIFLPLKINMEPKNHQIEYRNII